MPGAIVCTQLLYQCCMRTQLEPLLVCTTVCMYTAAIPVLHGHTVGILTSSPRRVKRYVISREERRTSTRMEKRKKGMGRSQRAGASTLIN